MGGHLFDRDVCLHLSRDRVEWKVGAYMVFGDVGGAFGAQDVGGAGQSVENHRYGACGDSGVKPHRPGRVLSANGTDIAGISHHVSADHRVVRGQAVHGQEAS